MKKKILSNPTECSIIDYRIEEAVVDQNGIPIIDEKTGRPKWTGKTLEWTIMAGETLEFPVYVADYLLGIFDFLKEVNEVKDEEAKKEIKKGKKREAGKLICKYCGQSFRTSVNLGVHVGAKHPKELL